MDKIKSGNMQFLRFLDRTAKEGKSELKDTCE